MSLTIARWPFQRFRSALCWIMCEKIKLECFPLNSYLSDQRPRKAEAKGTESNSSPRLIVPNWVIKIKIMLRSVPRRDKMLSKPQRITLHKQRISMYVVLGLTEVIARFTFNHCSLPFSGILGGARRETIFRRQTETHVLVGALVFSQWKARFMLMTNCIPIRPAVVICVLV